MAPLPDNLTDRYWLDYEGVYGKHSLMARFPALTSGSEAEAAMIALADACAPFLSTSTTITGLRRSDAGTDVSFPVDWVPVQGLNTTPTSQDQAPEFISFVGRSIDGVRVRYYLIGAPHNPDPNYRILRSESELVDDFLNVIENELYPFCTASGFIPVMNNYANLGYNAYFQRKRRKA